MSPQISSITTAVPTTASDLIGNMTTGGTTVTRRFSLADSLAAGFSAAGDLPYASSASSRSVLAIGSSEQILHVSAGIPAWKDSSAFLSTILTAAGDVLIRSSAGITRLAGASSAGYFAYSTVDGSIGPKWVTLDAGEIPMQTTAAGGTTSLQVPSSGGFLAYSTVDGSVGPVWRVGDAGTMYYGIGTTLAAGSSGQVLKIDAGLPAWENSAGSTVGFVLGLDTSQAFTTGVHTAIAWTEEIVDSDGFHTTVTNSTLVTIKSSGTYILTVNVQMNSAGGASILRLTDGSTEIAANSGDHTVFAPRRGMSLIRHFDSSGDVLTVTIYRNTTGAIVHTTGGGGGTFFSGWKISP